MHTAFSTSSRLVATALSLIAVLLSRPAPAQVGSHQKISAQGAFAELLDDGDRFGGAAVSIGDLDGDGVADLAVGAPQDDDGGADRGAVWILFLRADGSVKSKAKISTRAGGFRGVVLNGDNSGWSLAAMGDLDGDGVGDLVAGAPGDDDGGTDRGAVWILFLRADGTVKAHVQISDIHGGFFGLVSDGDRFGAAVTGLGDLDGDGFPDLLVGAPGASLQGPAHGAAWVLFLNLDGTVRSHLRVPSSAGFADDYHFGASAANLGDVDGDGVIDVAVGAPNTDMARGAVWILFLRTDGSVRSATPIGNAQGGFSGTLAPADDFGAAVAALDDQDGDGVVDVAVAAPGKDGSGAAWLLFLNAGGTVRWQQEIGASQGGFTGTLDLGDRFGSTVTLLGDLDGDGTPELVAGADQDDDGGTDRGAVWVLFRQPSTAAQYTLFGTGCQGSAGVPDLRPAVEQKPILGGTFTVEVRQLPAGPVFAMFGLSRTQWASAALPLDLAFTGMAGCSLDVSIDIGFPLAAVSGFAAWPVPIPSIPSFAGVDFYQQVFVFDPPANPGGATTSNAGWATVGVR